MSNETRKVLIEVDADFILHLPNLISDHQWRIIDQAEGEIVGLDSALQAAMHSAYGKNINISAALVIEVYDKIKSYQSDIAALKTRIAELEAGSGEASFYWVQAENGNTVLITRSADQADVVASQYDRRVIKLFTRPADQVDVVSDDEIKLTLSQFVDIDGGEIGITPDVSDLVKFGRALLGAKG